MTQIVNRLVMHHSAGGLAPSAVDKEHYHRITGGDGITVDGLHAINANAIGRRLTPGTYAAHTLNLNGGAIGLAMSCMLGAKWADPRACAAFPRPEQVKAFIVEAARLCALYGIAVDRKSVLTHAEVQTTLGVRQNGKWDFDYDPFGVMDTRDPVAIGDMLRAKIREAMRIQPTAIPTPLPPARPLLRRGARGDAVKVMQRLLGVKDDGAFGPATEAALTNFQESRELLADGKCGPATWAALEKGN